MGKALTSVFLFLPVLSLLLAGCGRKGPPLPPLVRVPAPPADVTAERHDDVVELRFMVPNANMDGSRPANLARIDVYAVTAPAAGLTEEQIMKLGTKIASVAVKAPRDPDQAIEADEPAGAIEPTQGAGLEQGTVAQATEKLSAEARQPIEVPKTPAPARTPDPAAAEPPSAEPTPPIVRTYLAVAVPVRGRRGPASKPANVALIDAPASPSPPTVGYDEREVAVSWTAVAAPAAAASAPAPTIAYHVYEVTPADDTRPAGLTRLTTAPVTDTKYADPRITWDVTRCYVVRAVATVHDLHVEGRESAQACVTLADRFPPAAPKDLQTIPSDGAISLIWEPSPEKDLRGYLIFRAIDPATTLEPITATPIRETSFRDNVAAGVRFVYAVKAVDNAGNASALSERKIDIAR